MDIYDLVLLLREKWINGIPKPIKELEQELYTCIRDLEIEDRPVSDLIASIVPDFTVPCCVMDIVLGVVSDKPMNLSLELGGTKMPNKVYLEPFTPIPLITQNGFSYPLINTPYHEIRFLNKPSDGKLWVLGVRLNKENKSLLSKPVKIPDLLLTDAGLYHVKDYSIAYKDKESQSFVWGHFMP